MMNTLFFVSLASPKIQLSFCISLDFSYLCFAKVVNSYSEIR